MFFLSIPQAGIVGIQNNFKRVKSYVGMGQTELMMTLHSIFVPLLLVISYYLFR